uniref:C-type lectin domain-containing protein n=2 Tax=Sphaeramia orbicularis TaxID=375764 RepID=A0A672Y873_9TELE
MTWSEATEHCTPHREDLWTDHVGSTSVRVANFPVWIGLYREGETWSWSTAETEYRHWDDEEPSAGNCVTIASLTKKMSTKNCSSLYPFTCFSDNLILVKENKTWEEALEHCRSFWMYPYNHYYIHSGLVSVQPGEDHAYMRLRVREATTEKVWVGLRFLVDQWRWVNGVDMLFSDLPECPVEQQRCGALSANSNSSTLEPMDCLETNNFLCYI